MTTRNPSPDDTPPPATDPGGGRATGRRRLGAAAAVLGIALVGGAAALGGAAATGNLGGQDTTIVREVSDAPSATAEPTPVERAAEAELPPAAEDGAALSVQEVVRRVSPAVVEVLVGGTADPLAGVVDDVSALGSGFVIDQKGRILTNQHVVQDASTVTVRFSDNTVSKARVLGTDPSMDIAVLQAETLPEGIEPVALGRSADLEVGDPLIAIGNPLGQDRTVTTGIVSALKRTIEAPSTDPITNVIQTDAAINSGNSGGPLFDDQGRVVGINSQIQSRSGGSDGIGFAVPIDAVRPVAESIIATGEPHHAWLGIRGQPLTPALAERLGLGERGGVAVVEVVDGSPADDAGIVASTSGPDAVVPEGADVIVAVAGRPVEDMADVTQQVSGRRVGERLAITVLRDGQEVERSVTLGDRP
jgi:putative serine protease PepD